MNDRRHVLAVLPALTIALSLIAGCNSGPEPFAKDERLEVSATVQAVDPATRMITVEGPNGRSNIIAGPEVRNFDQIRVGDRVQVSYYAALATQMTKKRGANGVPIEIIDSYRAAPGERPAAGATNTISMTMKIEAVDKTAHTVTFKRPDGLVQTLPVESPEGRAFVSKLSPGDEVDVLYMEAVAIAVTPASN